MIFRRDVWKKDFQQLKDGKLKIILKSRCESQLAIVTNLKAFDLSHRFQSRPESFAKYN